MGVRIGYRAWILGSHEVWNHHCKQANPLQSNQQFQLSSAFQLPFSAT
jgi:hypothetical protein